MSAKHTRIVSPDNVAFYMGFNPSLLMTTGPLKRRATHDQVKSSTSFTGKRMSVTKVKFRPESLEGDRTESSIRLRQKTIADPNSSPQNKAQGESLTLAESFITPRKTFSLGKDKPEPVEPSYEKSVVSEEVKQRIIENENLRAEIHRLESELRNCKKALKNNPEPAAPEMYEPIHHQLSDKEFNDILKSLEDLLNRSKQAYHSIERKFKKLDELIVFIESGVFTNYKGPEIQVLTDQLRLLLSTFKPSSELEIDLSAKTRELVRKKLELATLNARYQKQVTKSELLQQDLNMLKQSLKAGHVEKNVYVRSLTKEKSLNKETQKKLGDLQKTLEIMTEGQQALPAKPALVTQMTESNLFKESPMKLNESQVLAFAEKEVSTNKLRDALSKLVKQNESLRRVIHNKDKDILKLNDSLSKTIWKLDKANIRIDKLRNHKTSQKVNDGTQDEDDLLVIYSQNKPVEPTKHVTSDYTETTKGLPKNLDFRFGSFEEKYVDLINDVLEGGSQAFSEHVKLLTSEEEIKEEVALISNQFISYRNFSEKMNRTLAECCILFSLPTFNEIMIHVSTHMRQIMGATKVRLWANDPLTGTFRTVESQDKELKCIVTKGLVGEMIKTSSAILKRSHEAPFNIMEVMYPDGKSGVERAHTCLLMPLKSKGGQIVGFLEVLNFGFDTFLVDLNYFCQALGNVCVTLWERTNRERVISNDLKMKETFFDAFSELLTCPSQKQFSEKVEEWVDKIFQCPGSRYLVVDDNLDIVKFSKEASPRMFSKTMGIIGKVVTQKKPFIVLEGSGNALHSANVDLNTTLPLYTTPVVFKNINHKDKRESLIGVLQIIMSQKSFIKENGTDESVLNHSKALDPNMENLILKFTKLVSLAYDLMLMKAGYDGIVMESDQKKGM